jgi:hypothetical protein
MLKLNTKKANVDKIIMKIEKTKSVLCNQGQNQNPALAPHKIKAYKTILDYRLHSLQNQQTLSTGKSKVKPTHTTNYQRGHHNPESKKASRKNL